MRVLAFSQNSSKSDDLGWHRTGTDIRYFQNQIRNNGRFPNKKYYTLTFTHQFDSDNDTVYFTHCFPYTYSDLCEDLQQIENRPNSQNYCNRTLLTRTLAGNRCDMITITSKDKDPRSEKALNKKGVFISARVHPGETCGSWCMKGIIDYLTG